MERQPLDVYVCCHTSRTSVLTWSLLLRRSALAPTPNMAVGCRQNEVLPLNGDTVAFQGTLGHGRMM